MGGLGAFWWMIIITVVAFMCSQKTGNPLTSPSYLDSQLVWKIVTTCYGSKPFLTSSHPRGKQQYDIVFLTGITSLLWTLLQTKSRGRLEVLAVNCRLWILWFIDGFFLLLISLSPVWITNNCSCFLSLASALHLLSCVNMTALLLFTISELFFWYFILNNLLFFIPW